MQSAFRYILVKIENLLPNIQHSKQQAFYLFQSFK